MTASYPIGSGHCCVCSTACWHYSPATYCARHMQQVWWVPGTNHVTTGTFTTNANWKWASPYVGRHRKGDPEQGA